MDKRLKLQSLLETLTPKVYFQPPENVHIEYPSIVYQLDNADTKFADGIPYSYTKRYQITVIDQDPDSAIPDKVAALPMSVFQRHFTAENLNHDVFIVFF